MSRAEEPAARGDGRRRRRRLARPGLAGGTSEPAVLACPRGEAVGPLERRPSQSSNGGITRKVVFGLEVTGRVRLLNAAAAMRADEDGGRGCGDSEVVAHLTCRRRRRDRCTRWCSVAMTNARLLPCGCN